MFLRPLTVIDIFNVILNLKSSNGMGFDKTSNNLVKAAVHFVVLPLTHFPHLLSFSGETTGICFYGVELRHEDFDTNNGSKSMHHVFRVKPRKLFSLNVGKNFTNNTY
nr:unnamed protein product [Callosobruchus analis]